MKIKWRLSIQTMIVQSMDRCSDWMMFIHPGAPCPLDGRTVPAVTQMLELAPPPSLAFLVLLDCRMVVSCDSVFSVVLACSSASYIVVLAVALSSVKLALAVLLRRPGRDCF